MEPSLIRRFLSKELVCVFICSINSLHNVLFSLRRIYTLVFLLVKLIIVPWTCCLLIFCSLGTCCVPIFARETCNECWFVFLSLKRVHLIFPLLKLNLFTGTWHILIFVSGTSFTSWFFSSWHWFTWLIFSQSETCILILELAPSWF